MATSAIETRGWCLLSGDISLVSPGERGEGLSLGLSGPAPQTASSASARPPPRLLPPLLQIVCKGLEDPAQVVRNAALFALGQFSENLQVSGAERGRPPLQSPHPSPGPASPQLHVFSGPCRRRRGLTRAPFPPPPAPHQQLFRGGDAAAPRLPEVGASRAHKPPRQGLLCSGEFRGEPR